MPKEVVVVGAGLVGCLQAVYLARRGHSVTIFERWPDMRQAPIPGGRSINLVITKRGLAPLGFGLAQGALKLCVSVQGRMMHDVQGKTTFQPYGRETEWNNSISRTELNKFLLDSAEASGAKIFFNHALTQIDVPSSFSEQIALTFQSSGETVAFLADFVFGADGGGSAVRTCLEKQGAIEGVELDILNFSYKEIVFPSGPDRKYAMEPHALHIWPRGQHMLMALADLESSFTGTMYLPARGDTSFESLNTPDKVLDFFSKFYPDVISLVGGPELLVKQFLENPAGLLGTVHCSPWDYRGRVLLIGDASHAITPFFGQGCNSGFEDCAVFDKLLDKYMGNLPAAITEFSRARKVDTEAIATMALENFVEMRDRVGDPAFLLTKAVEHLIEDKFPRKFRSRYAMVVYSQIPYSICQALGKINAHILEILCRGLKDPNQVDLELAESLIDQHLTPAARQKGVSFDFDATIPGPRL